MFRLIQINGTIEIPKNVSHDDFMDEFLTWCESKGYYFGGGTVEIEDDNEEEN